MYARDFGDLGTKWSWLFPFMPCLYFPLSNTLRTLTHYACCSMCLFCSDTKMYLSHSRATWNSRRHETDQGPVQNRSGRSHSFRVLILTEPGHVKRGTYFLKEDRRSREPSNSSLSTHLLNAWQVPVLLLLWEFYGETREDARGQGTLFWPPGHLWSDV